MKIGKGMVAGLGIASLLVALPAGAQDKSGSTGATSGGTASSATAGETHATGKVEKVDESKKELTLRLKVSESTQVMKDGKAATLADIKEGDQVRASFSATGEAVRIDVVSPGKPGGSMAPSGGPGSTPSGPSGSSGSSSGRGY